MTVHKHVRVRCIHCRLAYRGPAGWRGWCEEAEWLRTLTPQIRDCRPLLPGGREGERRGGREGGREGGRGGKEGREKGEGGEGGREEERERGEEVR